MLGTLQRLIPESCADMWFPKFLKVGVWEDIGKSQYEIENNVKKFNAECVDIVRLLSKALGFQYNLTAPSDGETGRCLPDGNWTGMVGMLQRGEADMVVARLSITEERSKVISFSYPYFSGDVTFAVRKASYVPDIKTFLKPFSVYVWFAVAVCLIILPCIFHAFAKRKYTLTKIFLSFYSIFWRNSLLIGWKKLGGCILITNWVIGAMLLSYCYSAVLLSFLTFPPLAGVRNIRELSSEVAKGNYKCSSYPGSFFAYALISSKESYVQVIGKNILENEGTADIESVLKNTRNFQPAYIAPLNDFSQLIGRYFISKDSFFPFFDAIGMQKNFCCLSQLDKAVHYIWAGGLVQKIEADRSFLKNLKKLLNSSTDDLATSERSLTLEDFEGPFIVLASGYALAIIVFLVELIFHKYKV